MRALMLIMAALSLSGCIEIALKQTTDPYAPAATPCFSIKEIGEYTAYARIKMNTCTGDTWILLPTDVEKTGDLTPAEEAELHALELELGEPPIKVRETKSFKYAWYKIATYNDEVFITTKK